MGSTTSQNADDFIRSLRIAEKRISSVVFDTEKDANTYSELVREKGVFVEIVPENGKFSVTRHFVPPLGTGVYTIHNPTVMKWFNNWARQNHYVTSITGDIIAIGVVANSRPLLFGIPDWYTNMSQHQIETLLKT